MPYDPNDDEIIRHGNLGQWLGYQIGPHKLRGWWILTAVALLAFIGGLLV